MKSDEPPDQNSKSSEQTDDVFDLESIDFDIRKELASDMNNESDENLRVCGKTNSTIPRCYDIRNIKGVSYDTPVVH